jgi:peptidoglycan/xylan/chitin deacetylase (PgdA/CDA1 family)
MRLFLVAVFGLLSGCTNSTGAADPPLRGPAPTKQIAVTLDDLPFANRKASVEEVKQGISAILRALGRHRIKAVGFVNEDRLADTGRQESDVRLLKQWLDAGMELGNHNYGHVGFQTTSLEAYQEAVLRGEQETRGLMRKRGQKLRYYRHPFTQTGPDKATKAAFEAFLQQRGYTVAPFTIEHDDYMFSAVYDDALARGDTAEAARVRTAYRAHLEKAVSAFESMSADLFNRQIPHIFLIHANRLNADTLEGTLGALRRRGYGFISLDRALSDPAYSSPDGYIGPAGPSWLLRWARGLRTRTRVGGQPDPEPWVQERYKAITSPPA